VPSPKPLRDRVDVLSPSDLPEDGDGLTWRRIRLDDAVAVHALERATGILDHPHSVVPLEAIEQDLRSEHLDLSHDTTLAEDAAGELVAYGTVMLLPGQETLVRVLLGGTVRAERRGEGIGTRLLDWQQRRAREQLAGSELAHPGWIVGDADEKNADVRRLFARAGFEERRWWLELERDLAEPVPRIDLDTALRLVPYGREWFEHTRGARNDVFRDHWGSQSFTAAEWDDMWSLPTARLDLSFLAVDADDQVVAFVLSDVNEDEWEQVGHSFGYVHYVGVRRAWRGRRIAQALLTHVLNAYRGQGFATAILEVDSESPTGATGLYAGLGFAPINRTVSLVREF
jgi:mycothiol synthase